MKQVGKINLSANVDIAFSLYHYHGVLYGTITKYKDGLRTNKGIMLTEQDMRNVLDKIGTLPDELTIDDDVELFRKTISEGYYVIVKLWRPDKKLYLDFRQYKDKGKFPGFRKRGISIPYEKISDTVYLLELMLKEFRNS